MYHGLKPWYMTRMDFHVEFTRFRPKDVAAVIGLTTAMQRDWRRHGFLPARPGGGWSSFSLVEVTRLAIRKAIADAGLGPAFANLVLESADATTIGYAPIYWAIVECDATWAVSGGSNRSEAVARELKDLADNDRLDLASRLCSVATPARYVTIAPASQTLHLSVDLPDPGQFALDAVTITLNLESIGCLLAARAPRPLALVRVGQLIDDGAH
jgi:hypothetical protein